MSQNIAAMHTTTVEGDAARLFALDQTLIDDPFELYRRMRSEAPVMRVGSVVAVSKYDDIKQVFRDTDNFSSIRSRGSRVTDRQASLTGEDLDKYNYLIRSDLAHIGQQDKPNHSRLRRFVNETFSAATINATRSKMTELANELLDQIEASGNDPFDLSAYSYRLPFVWMCRMLGVPAVEIDTFRGWAIQLRVGLGTNHENLDESYAANVEVENWVRNLIDDRRAQPPGTSDDLVAKLLATESGGQYLTDDELVTMFTVMLTTGNTNDMISNAVIALEARPDQKQLLLEEPDRMRGAIEEFFRFCPSVHTAHRVAAKDCEIAGFPVKEGETVRLMLASAHRDSDKFANADVLDIQRKDARQHLDFGFGIHTCLGQWLSRLEIDVALTVLFERYPNLRVAEPVQYRRNYAFHGPDVLMVSPR